MLSCVATKKAFVPLAIALAAGVLLLLWQTHTLKQRNAAVRAELRVIAGDQ